MATISGAKAAFSAQRGFRESFNSALLRTAQSIAGTLVQATDATGTIPARNEARVLRLAGDTVQRFFVGADLRQPFACDGVTPLAPYPQLLNYWMAWVTVQVIDKHSRYMQQRLPEDIQTWLQTRMLREQIQRNPLAQYEPAHIWVDPNGYRLSDNIWQTSVRTRMRIDALLTEKIRNGDSALNIAKAVEQFLLPNRAAFRTKKPYGRDASFDGMRLARTEIARAHSQATFTASYANPFVDGMDWALSGSHPKYDICDRLATIGMDGKRIKDPYPLADAPMVVKNSHPQCICTNRASSSRSTQDVIAELRTMMGKGDEPPVTPIDTWRFARLLLGGYLVNLIQNELVSSL